MMFKGFDIIDEHHDKNKKILNDYKEKNYNSFKNKCDLPSNIFKSKPK